MKNNRVVCLILTLLFLPGMVCSQTAQSSASGGRIPYVIAFSGIDREDGTRRLVDVLITPEYFTEANLISILRLVDKRFNRPSLIYINFFTQINELPTPEEYDSRSGFSGSHVATARKPTNSATCVRLKRGEYGNCFIFYSDGTSKKVSVYP